MVPKIRKFYLKSWVKRAPLKLAALFFYGSTITILITTLLAIGFTGAKIGLVVAHYIKYGIFEWAGEHTSLICIVGALLGAIISSILSMVIIDLIDTYINKRIKKHKDRKEKFEESMDELILESYKNYKRKEGVKVYDIISPKEII